MNRGAVLHIPDLEFHDGGHGNKLLVVLSAPEKFGKVFAVKTTSVPNKRKFDLGCQPAKKEYFIRAGNEFPKDTWIVLSGIPFLLPIEGLRQNIENGKCTVVNTLPEQMVNAIRNCLKKFSEDLNMEARELLN